MALARNSSTATAQVCLAEAELDQARAASMAPERRRHLETAAAVYKRALALPADEVVKGAILERLLVVFDDTGLNDPSEMVRALEALIAL